MNIFMSWSKVTSLLFAMSFVAACGGGGKGEAEARPLGFDLGYNAADLVYIDDVKCIPQIPTWGSFNSYAYEQSQQPPLMNTTVILSESDGVGGGSTVEIPLIDQNEESIRTMNDLVMNVKDFGSNELGARIYGFYPYQSNNDKPQMKYSPNKEAYQYIRTRCRSVECVGDSLFGETWGARFYVKENFGISISGLISPKSEEYRDASSVREVIFAISSLPNTTFPVAGDRFTHGYDVFAQNIVITPYATGETLPGQERASAVMSSYRTGDGLLFNADIMMFDNWKEVDKPYRKAMTIFHELMHVLDITVEKRTSLSQTKEWVDLSDWLYDETQGQWYANNRVMCSVYGRENPTEDFAECGLLYRYAPDTLKKISKKKYDFFKKRVFFGVEYTSESSCAKSSVKFF